MTPMMRGAIRCGQNSLPIYCLGVLLAFASHIALLDISDGIAMQIALSLGGIVAMIVTATLLNLISIKPRQQSQYLQHCDQQNVYEDEHRRRDPG